MSIKMFLPVIAIAQLVLLAGTATGEDKKAQHWGYSGEVGPSHWADLKPEFAACRDGHQQSPIDIRGAEKAELAALEFYYKPSPLHIIDNGHTVMINYAPSSFIRVGQKRYDLKQFHFHMPSEEKINGRASAMGVHLVHADSDGNLAVVAVLLDKGADNPLIHELWTDLPKEKEKEVVLDDIQINLSRLLPSNLGYYTFSGSLTTPPCSENVTWFVLKQPVTVSEAELKQFAALYRNNARPVQALNGRMILESK